MPEGAVYIGRVAPRYRLCAGKWANPFRLRDNATDQERAEVIAKYEQHLVESGLINEVQALRGKDLVCWCAPPPCHSDIATVVGEPIKKLAERPSQRAALRRLAGSK